MEIASIKDVLQILRDVVIIVGVPGSIYAFFRQRRRERIAREFEVVNQVEQRMMQYFEISIRNIDIDAADFSIADFPDEKKRRELIVLSTLLLTLEHVFLTYREVHAPLRQRVWPAWEAYIRSWLVRPNFIEAWNLMSDMWDIEFVTYMKRLIAEQSRSRAVR